MTEQKYKRASKIFVISIAVFLAIVVIALLNLFVMEVPNANIVIALPTLILVSFVETVAAYVFFYNAAKGTPRNTANTPEDMKDISDLPEYIGHDIFFGGNPKTGKFLFACECIFVLLIILGQINPTFYILLSMNIFLVILVQVFMIKHLMKRMTIKQDGIYYYNFFGIVKYYFPWDNIKSIGISESKYKTSRVGFLYVSSRETKEILKIRQYTESRVRVMIAFRPSAVHCIMKYYKGHIHNLDNNKKWHEYVRKMRQKPVDDVLQPMENVAAAAAPPIQEKAQTVNEKRYTGRLTYTPKDQFYFATPASRRILWICGSLFVLCSIGIDAFSGEDAIFAYLITAIFAFSLAKAYSRKMTVAKEGIFFKNYVRNKTYFFAWTDIKSIGISEYYGDKPALNEFLYISKGKMDELADIPRYMENENICMIMFQPKAAARIKMHHGRKISNLEWQRKWKRYIQNNKTK
ncbi:MAG: hypothetical protein AB1Z23_03545 [Eubacteriales bacterium]